MLEAKANVNAAEEDDYTALMFASQNGHADVCAYSWVISFIKIDFINITDVTDV